MCWRTFSSLSLSAVLVRKWKTTGRLAGASTGAIAPSERPTPERAATHSGSQPELAPWSANSSERVSTTTSLPWPASESAPRAAAMAAAVLVRQLTWGLRSRGSSVATALSLSSSESRSHMAVAASATAASESWRAEKTRGTSSGCGGPCWVRSRARTEARRVHDMLLDRPSRSSLTSVEASPSARASISASATLRTRGLLSITLMSTCSMLDLSQATAAAVWSSRIAKPASSTCCDTPCKVSAARMMGKSRVSAWGDSGPLAFTRELRARVVPSTSRSLSHTESPSSSSVAMTAYSARPSWSWYLEAAGLYTRHEAPTSSCRVPGTEVERSASGARGNTTGTRRGVAAWVPTALPRARADKRLRACTARSCAIATRSRTAASSASRLLYTSSSCLVLWTLGAESRLRDLRYSFSNSTSSASYSRFSHLLLRMFLSSTTGAWYPLSSSALRHSCPGAVWKISMSRLVNDPSSCMSRDSRNSDMIRGRIVSSSPSSRPEHAARVRAVRRAAVWSLRAVEDKCARICSMIVEAWPKTTALKSPLAPARKRWPRVAKAMGCSSRASMTGWCTYSSSCGNSAAGGAAGLGNAAKRARTYRPPSALVAPSAAVAAAAPGATPPRALRAACSAVDS
mmetsp:Transcript_36317/g.82798  ORF Transcript_36317/g.82798 Transcript_36317/m.82798 type:complete len:630 (+) Transcript_36317:4332-6221(+)